MAHMAEDHQRPREEGQRTNLKISVVGEAKLRKVLFNALEKVLGRRLFYEFSRCQGAPQYRKTGDDINSYLLGL